MGNELWMNMDGSMVNLEAIWNFWLSILLIILNSEHKINLAGFTEK
jgi:hypothetical protein